MKKLFLIIFVLFVTSVAGIAQPKQEPLPYAIDSIKAYLYLNTKGEMSKEITDNFLLFNTIIGEGDAGSPSHATMVVVKINRKFEMGSETRKIRLTATIDGLPLLTQTLDFSLYDNDYAYYAAFMLQNTGCGAVKLVAEIINEKMVNKKKVQTVESKSERVIDYRCGE